MKIKYLNESAFGSYKDKTTKEDKLKNLKKETVKVLINDIVKKLPEELTKRIGDKSYIDSIHSKRSVESYNYNFSQMFLSIVDFLGVEVEGNTIYLKFVSKFISSNGYTSNGPTSYKINIYGLDSYNRYLMTEALCKDLNEEYGPGINFDFRFVTYYDFRDVRCDDIHIDNRNKINSWSLETLQKVIKYPEFLVKHKDVYENRTADEVYLKILQKTFNNDNTQFKSIIERPTLSAENIRDAVKYENKAVQYALKLCQTYPDKIKFYINHPNNDLNTLIDNCEALIGQPFEQFINHLRIYAKCIAPETISDKAFLKIVQEISNISDNHFYVSTMLNSTKIRRILTPCESVEQAMNILIDRTYGEKISCVEIGLYKGTIKTHDSTFNNMVQRVKRQGDYDFYYLHVAINDL